MSVSGDEHFMHLLQARSTVKGGQNSAKVEERILAFLDLERDQVSFESPVVEDKDDSTTYAPEEGAE